LVVFLSPFLNQYLSFSQRSKYLTVEQLIPQLSIKRFDVTILPGVSRFYVQHLHSQAGAGSVPKVVEKEIDISYPIEKAKQTEGYSRPSKEGRICRWRKDTTRDRN
jgi:hypothetical protein